MGRGKPEGCLEKVRGKLGWSGLKVFGRNFFYNSIVQALVVVVVLFVFIVVVLLSPPCSLWLSPYSGELS